MPSEECERFYQAIMEGEDMPGLKLHIMSCDRCSQARQQVNSLERMLADVPEGEESLKKRILRWTRNRPNR